MRGDNDAVIAFEVEQCGDEAVGGLIVESSRGLIEQEYPWVEGEGPGDRQSGALMPGQTASKFSLMVPLRKNGSWGQY